MDPSPLIDRATADANAAIAPHLRRLGVYGVNFEQLIREAVRAALAATVAAHDADCAASLRLELAGWQASRLALVLELEQARAALAPLRAAHAEMAEALDVARADRDRFERQAGTLASVLDIIERLPYEGSEPHARRIARQALHP